MPPGGLQVALDVGKIASEPASPQERAEALLEPLGRLVPFEAAAIYLFDLRRQLSTPILSQGYDAAVGRFITSPAAVDEIELLGLTVSHPPMRLRDLPVPREKLRSWVELLEPAGFREGLSVGLYTSDGRHLGILGVNTDTEEHPTEEARDLVGALAPLIANAVDPMRSLSTVAGIVGDAEAGAVLTGAGAALPLAGLPPHPLLVGGSAVLATALSRLLAGHVHQTFLCPYPTDGAAEAHLRITVLAVPPATPSESFAAVLVSPPGNLRRLTPRELQILGLLVEGWPNQRISAALVIAPRTVNAHVEHILAKLDAGTRTLAAVRALRLGLYVPRRLSNTRG